VDSTALQSDYHQFVCSKCHNPHASRLPKLMITNCLDIKHNSWDDNKSSQTKYTKIPTGWTARPDISKKPAYYTSAQNCHRRDDGTEAMTKNPGWNKVTPW
jgi:hypothetical protein